MEVYIWARTVAKDKNEKPKGDGVFEQEFSSELNYEEVQDKSQKFDEGSITLQDYRSAIMASLEPFENQE